MKASALGFARVVPGENRSPGLPDGAGPHHASVLQDYIRRIEDQNKDLKTRERLIWNENRRLKTLNVGLQYNLDTANGRLAKAAGDDTGATGPGKRGDLTLLGHIAARDEIIKGLRQTIMILKEELAAATEPKPT